MAHGGKSGGWAQSHNVCFGVVSPGTGVYWGTYALNVDYQLESLYLLWLSTWKFVFVRSERFLFNTMAWNLSWFTIILFILNHSIAMLFTRSEIVFAQAAIVLSSAKLWIGEGSMKKKRSLIQKSNRSGPTIEPCGTPVMIFSKLLCVVYTDTLFSIL